MIRLRITGYIRPKGRLTSRPGWGGEPVPLGLAISWADWRVEFLTSILVLLFGPAPPKEFLGEPYFRDCLIEQRSPKVAFAAAVACQALLILFPPPVWNIRPAQAEAYEPPMALTWYGPVKAFPAILPEARAPKAAPPNNAYKV